MVFPIIRSSSHEITNHLDKPNQLITVKGMTVSLDLETDTCFIEQFDIRAGYSVLKRAYQAPDLTLSRFLQISPKLIHGLRSFISSIFLS